MSAPEVSIDQNLTKETETGQTQVSQAKYGKNVAVVDAKQLLFTS